jgi:iron complex transport system ATP-binding protein
MVELGVRDVSFGYGSEVVIKNVTLNAFPGKMVAIIGPNGSGKTTLLKLLANIIKPSTGKIMFDGVDIRRMDKDEITKIVSYSPQENVIPGILTVYEVVLLGRIPYLSWRISRDDLEITKNVLEELGLEIYARKYANQLSGGERQMILIAQALVREPKLLLLDEPVSNLDIRNQLEILDLIKRITRQKEITTITVLHDLNLAARYADKLVVLNRGSIYTCGEPEAVLTPDMLSSVYGVEAKINRNNRFVQIIPIRPLNRGVEALGQNF